MIANPAGAKHADATRYLKDADGPACQFGRKRYGTLLKERGSPVEYGETHDINQQVTDGETPDDRIAEYLFAYVGFERGIAVVVVNLGLGVG